MRLIDADALWEEIEKSGFYNRGMALIHINAATTVDAVPVVHGRWIDKPTGAYGRWQSWCSACGKRSGIGGTKQHKPYCPNCGARMDGGDVE